MLYFKDTKTWLNEITEKKKWFLLSAPSQQVSIPWISWIRRHRRQSRVGGIWGDTSWPTFAGPCQRGREKVSAESACSHVPGYLVVLFCKFKLVLCSCGGRWDLILRRITFSGGHTAKIGGCGRGETLAIISIMPSSVFDPERVGIDTISVLFGRLHRQLPACSSQQIPIKMFWNCLCVFLNGHFRTSYRHLLGLKL